MKLNTKLQLLVYTDGVNLLGKIMNITKKNTEAILDASNEVNVEVT
jgi:hypothetical protein